MERKSTDDLQSELMAQPNLELYIKQNEAHFCGQTVPEILTELFRRRNVSKAELARRAGMSEVYIHQVFSGRRRPSRDRLLCICISLELTLEETQDLLKRAAYAPVYPRIRRDAIICHGIVHGTGLEEINDKLFEENEKSLF